jgi:hypothetical protein
MQSCAFFWGKSDISKDYRRPEEFAIVLGKMVTAGNCTTDHRSRSKRKKSGS